MAILQRLGGYARQAIQGVAGVGSIYHWVAHLTLALALFGAAMGWRQCHLARALDHAKAAQAGARATGAALVVKERRKAVTAQAADRAATRLSGASQGHPTWADETVPQEVQDAFAP
jgi:hypothetical protein